MGSCLLLFMFHLLYVKPYLIRFVSVIFRWINPLGWDLSNHTLYHLLRSKITKLLSQIKCHTTIHHHILTYPREFSMKIIKGTKLFSHLKVSRHSTPLQVDSLLSPFLRTRRSRFNDEPFPGIIQLLQIMILSCPS